MCDGGDTRTRPPLDAIVPAQELCLYAPSCTWSSTGPTRVASPLPIFHVDHTHSPCALTYTLGLRSISPLLRARPLRENLSPDARLFAVRPRASDYYSFAWLLARYSPTCVLLYKRGISCHKGLLSRSFQSIKLTVTLYKRFFFFYLSYSSY